MDTEELTRMARFTADQRTWLATLKADLSEREAAFKAQNTPLLEAIKIASVVVEQSENGLRDDAKAFHLAHPDAPLPPGLTVRHNTTIHFDEAQATAFAHEKGLFLTLDRKAFEAFAKQSPPPFVTKQTVVAIALAKDLDAALAGAV